MKDEFNPDSYPDWDLEAYERKEEDEDLDYYKEFLPLVKYDPIYFCKYELDFQPWEYGDTNREEILEYMDSIELDKKLYPDYGHGQADLIRAICNDEFDHVVAACGGRSGKTLSYFGSSMFNLFSRFSKENRPRSPMSVIIAAHRQEHAITVIMDEIKSRLHYSKNVKKFITSDSQTMLGFEAQNCRLYTIPVSDYGKIQGQTNAVRIMLDEAVRIRDPMVIPTAERLLFEDTRVQMADGSWYPYNVQLVLTSTPEGFNNKFAQKFQVSQNPKFPNYKTIRWHSFDSPYFNAEKALQNLLEPNANVNWWRQEFGAEFIYSSSGFFEPELLDRNIDESLGAWGNLNPSNFPMYYGIDWGSVHDSTVIWVLEDRGIKVQTKYIEEISHTEYDQQIARIRYIARELPPKIVKADANGRAQNVILANQYGLPLEPITGVNMSLKGKHEMYHNAKYLLQAGDVVCPPNRKWYEQMIGLRTEKTLSGLISFKDDVVGYDDFCDAFVLACSCKKPRGGYRPKMRIDQRSTEPTRKLERARSKLTRKEFLERERKLVKRKKYDRRKR